MVQLFVRQGYRKLAHFFCREKNHWSNRCTAWRLSLPGRAQQLRRVTVPSREFVKQESCAFSLQQWQNNRVHRHPSTPSRVPFLCLLSRGQTSLLWTRHTDWL